VPTEKTSRNRQKRAEPRELQMPETNILKDILPGKIDAGKIDAGDNR
jgi:hypothetical protein